MRFELIFYPFACALFILLMLLIARFWRVDKSAPTVPKPPRWKLVSAGSRGRRR